MPQRPEALDPLEKLHTSCALPDVGAGNSWSGQSKELQVLVTTVPSVRSVPVSLTDTWLFLRTQIVRT